MLKLDEVSYESQFGTINVGDPVVVITEGYSHSIKMRRGIYLGINENGNVRVEVQLTRSQFFKKGTNEEVHWTHPSNDRELRYIDYMRKTTLFANRIIPLPKQ